MKYGALLLTASLAFASCSPSEAPPVAKPPSVKPPVAPPPPTPAPAPAPTPPPAPAPTPSVEKEILELPTRKPPTPPPPKKAPPPDRPDIVHLPAFTFRTIDKGEAVVWVNGQEFSTTPCLWAISEATEFDQKIPVPEWPPAGAKFIGSTQVAELPNQKAELYLEDRKDALAGIKGLGPNDIVLYVKGRAGNTNLQGALRLHVEGYRYTIYTPLVDPEGDAASKFLRTLWFEGKPKQ